MARATCFHFFHVPCTIISSGLPLFQNESSCKNFSYENEFDLHENEVVVSHLDSS